MLRLCLKVFAITLLTASVAMAGMGDELRYANAMGYIAEKRAEYEIILTGMSDELANLRSSLNMRVNTLNMQNDFFSSKLTEDRDKIETFAVLSDESKNCYANQISKLPNSLDTLNNLSNCSTSFFVDFNIFLTEAKANHNDLQTHFRKNFNDSLNECQTKYTKTTEYNECVANEMKTMNNMMRKSKRTFASQILQASFKSEIRLLEAHACSFEIIYNTAYAFGSAQALILKCPERLKNGEKCAAPGTEQCTNKKSITLTPDDFTKDTIANPFQGLGDNSACVLFDINKPTA